MGPYADAGRIAVSGWENDSAGAHSPGRQQAVTGSKKGHRHTSPPEALGPRRPRLALSCTYQVSGPINAAFSFKLLKGWVSSACISGSGPIEFSTFTPLRLYLNAARPHGASLLNSLGDLSGAFTHPARHVSNSCSSLNTQLQPPLLTPSFTIPTCSPQLLPSCCASLGQRRWAVPCGILPAQVDDSPAESDSTIP